MRFTDQQENAINGKGNALLVSAAAGSGKTAVLIERVLRYLTAQGGSVRRLIIMTYTKAAAEEMRMKLKSAVDKYLKEQGGDDHLLQESTLIDSAEIGTIHSICLGLITRYFEPLGLDPRLRLIDETAEAAMVEEQVEALLEEYYGKEGSKELAFFQTFSSGRNDEALKELLVKGMRFLEKQPLPDHFIERALAPYQKEGSLFDCFAEDGLYQLMYHQLQEVLAQGGFYLRRVQGHPELRDFPQLEAFVKEEAYMPTRLPRLLAQRDYEAYRKELDTLQFATLPWKRLTEGMASLEAREDFDRYRKAYKDAVKGYCARFANTEEEELSLLRQEGEWLRVYFDLCRRLSHRLAEARRKGGWISYQDMEQLAVRLLVEDYDPKTDRLTPTPLAKELQQDYDEIIIDEFQDTNRAQDLIFRALSKEEKNLFMVGDMKQSIYRFRGAEPEIFDQKRKQSVPFEGKELTAKTVLELNTNFRSHAGVLRCANRVFSAIMSPALGGVVYDEREQLNEGQTFDDPAQTAAELHWLEPMEDERGRPLEKIVQNARYAAQLIRKAVEEKQEICLPGGGKKPADYGDFAILLRTVSRTAPAFEKALREAGIPVTNRNEGDLFFDLPEVQSILAYLLVLNNPYDDVALVSLLYGDYFRFTVGELAAIRHRRAPLYDDLKKAAATDPKARRAYETIEKYRRLSGGMYVYDLLYRIYGESGIFGAYAGGEKGAERCANLEMLAEDARLFEQDGYRGLYAFVQHIRISRERTQSGARLKNEQNSVQIMSIHKSKGLQFPVCILGDCQKTFSTADAKETVLLHPRFGAAIEDSIPALHCRFRSLAQRVLEEQINTDSVSEEERVLYVALTRPQSKVIALVNADRKTMEDWVDEGISFKEKLPFWAIKKKGGSFARWLAVLMAGAEEGEALRKECGFLPQLDRPNLHMTYVKGILAEGEAASAQKTETAPAFDAVAFRKRLDWVYPHLTAVGLPAKLSVSELKGLREAEEDAQPLLERQVKQAVPRFASESKVRGNEVGNALHQALQFCDFSRLAEDAEEELSRLVAQGFILEEQRALIPVEKIRRFTQSPSFIALMQADRYYKEERFLFPMAASELFGSQAEGEILIQGVLDCYWVKDGNAVILDYKTDRVAREEELIARYRVQMDLYEEALKRVRDLRVLRREIYSFSLEKTIIL